MAKVKKVKKMVTRVPPSVHAERTEMNTTATTDVHDYEPEEPDEEDEASMRNQKRARGGDYVQRTEEKETEDYSSEGELSLPTNASVKGANARKTDSLYWAVIAPDTRKEWTEPQKASALRISVEDLAACRRIGSDRDQ